MSTIKARTLRTPETVAQTFDWPKSGTLTVTRDVETGDITDIFTGDTQIVEGQITLAKKFQQAE